MVYYRSFDENDSVWSSNTATLTHHDLGYRMDQTVNRHELALKGLSGDTYSVSYIDNSGVTRVYNDNGGAGFTEVQTLIIQDVRPEVLIVTVSGAAGAGSREVWFTSSARDLAE